MVVSFNRGMIQQQDVVRLGRAQHMARTNAAGSVQKAQLGPKADVFEIAPAAKVTLKSAPKTRRLIGIYGGSFDPPTLGHLSCIQHLATAYRHPGKKKVNGVMRKTRRPLDEIWIVPNDKHWKAEKRKGRAPYEDRIRMLELAVGNLEAEHRSLVPTQQTNKRIKISRADREAGGVSHPVKRIRHIASQCPDAQLVIFFGTDMRKEVEAWPEIGDLRQMAEVVFLERPGYETGGSVKMKQKMSVSSTEIRKAVAAGDVDAIRGKVDPSVLEYLMSRPGILGRYKERHKGDIQDGPNVSAA